MKCEICGREFKGKRASAKYCSAKCRVQGNRVSVTNGVLSVTDSGVSVTKNGLSVTENPLSVTNDGVSVTKPKVSVTSESLKNKDLEVSVTDEVPENTGIYTKTAVSVTNEGIEWTAKDVKDRDAVSLLGHKLSDLDMNQEIRIGSVQLMIGDVPWWMLTGPLNRDSLPLASGRYLSAEDKRQRFRDFMLQIDMRYASRDKTGELLSGGLI